VGRGRSDHPYYQGPAWYRTTFPLDNPFPNGRTLLHFEGAGQNSEVFIGLQSAGRHVGGYDEFTFDITEAARSANGKVQLSRAVRQTPAAMKPFPPTRATSTLRRPLPARQPGLHTGALARACAHRHARRFRQRQRLGISGLFNATALGDSLRIETRVLDPAGRWYIRRRIAGAVDGRTTHRLVCRAHAGAVVAQDASLYTCAVTLKSPHGEHRVEERFGLRYFEFPNTASSS